MKATKSNAVRRLRLELLEGRSLLAGDLLSCSVLDTEQLADTFDAAVFEEVAEMSVEGETQLRWNSSVHSEEFDADERKRQRQTLLDIGSLRAEGEEGPTSSDGSSTEGSRVGARNTSRSFAIPTPDSIAGPQLPSLLNGSGSRGRTSSTPQVDAINSSSNSSAGVDYAIPSTGDSASPQLPTQSDLLTPDNGDQPLSSLNLRAFGTVTADVESMQIESASVSLDSVETQFDASLFAPALTNETLADPTGRDDAYPSNSVVAKYVPYHDSDGADSATGYRDALFGHLFSNQDSPQLRELDSLLKSLSVPAEAARQGEQANTDDSDLLPEHNVAPNANSSVDSFAQSDNRKWESHDDGMMALDLPGDLLPTEPSDQEEQLTAWNSPIGIYRPDSLGIAQGGAAAERSNPKSESQREDSFSSQVATELVTEGLRPIIAATSVALGAILFGHRKQKQRDAKLLMSHQKLQ